MPIFLIKSRALHGRIDFRGLSISIENRKGSIRSWYDPNADESGMTRMSIPYGYIRLTESNGDGEHVDCFIGPHREASMVYIVNQMKSPDFTKHDEQKVFLGMESAAAAKTAYLKHYSDPRFFGSMIEMPFEEFRDAVLQTKENGGKAIAKALSMQSVMDDLAAPFVADIKAFTSGRFFTESELRTAARGAVHPQINELLLGKTRAMMQTIEQEGRKLIAVAGGNPKAVPFDEFRRGYKVEQEHKDVTGGDPILTAKIVLSHIRERSNYYTRLERYVEKAISGVFLLKSHVKGHSRRSQSGAVTIVKDHFDRRSKKAPGRKDKKKAQSQTRINREVHAYTEWARKHFPNTEWDLRGTTAKTMIPTLKQFYQLAKEYPSATTILHQVSTYTDPETKWQGKFPIPGIPGFIATDKGRTVIGLNPEHYGNRPTMVEHLSREKVKKELLPVLDVVYPITHEFGHLLYRQINADHAGAAEKWATENRSKWRHTKLARKNIKEAFAEGFAELELYQPSGLSRYAKSLKKFLEEYHG